MARTSMISIARSQSLLTKVMKALETTSPLVAYKTAALILAFSGDSSNDPGALVARRLLDTMDQYPADLVKDYGAVLAAFEKAAAPQESDSPAPKKRVTKVEPRPMLTVVDDDPDDDE